MTAEPSGDFLIFNTFLKPVVSHLVVSSFCLRSRKDSRRGGGRVELPFSCLDESLRGRPDRQTCTTTHRPDPTPGTGSTGGLRCGAQAGECVESDRATSRTRSSTRRRRKEACGPAVDVPGPLAGLRRNAGRSEERVSWTCFLGF